MDSVIKSFWFWLLLIGMVAILASILIAGGMKEMKGWTWGVFVVGCVLALLGIIFGLIAWSRYVPCVEEASCSTTIDSCGCDVSPDKGNLNFSSPSYVSNSPYSSSPYSSSPAYVSSPPAYVSNAVSSSPSGTSYIPTRVVSNVPQTERGFSTSSLNLSSLAPKSSSNLLQKFFKSSPKTSKYPF